MGLASLQRQRGDLSLSVVMSRRLTLHSSVHSATRRADAAANGGADKSALGGREHDSTDGGADRCTGGSTCNGADGEILRSSR